MNYLRVVNWDKYQQYKDRAPLWLKLHRTLLDDYEYTHIPDAQRSHLIGLWILAAASENKIPHDSQWVKDRLSATSKVDLDGLVKAGFLEPHPDSSDFYRVRTDSVHTLCVEKRREEERREEERREEEIDCPEPVPCSEPDPDSEVLITFQTSGKPDYWDLTRGKLKEYYRLYGKQLDVLQEARKALQWLKDNPTRTKTATGMPKFLNGWMARAVNSGTGAKPKPPRSTQNPDQLKARVGEYLKAHADHDEYDARKHLMSETEFEAWLQARPPQKFPQASQDAHSAHRRPSGVSGQGPVSLKLVAGEILEEAKEATG